MDDDKAAAWLLRLRIRHLEVFRMLVRTGSQSETAALMHITQPALSKWLRELEEQAGCALMQRGRPLRLTADGEVLLRYAERVLGDSLRTGKELEAMRAGSSGLLRVGVLRAVAPVLVPHAILRCRQEAPRLQIRLYEDSLDNLLPYLSVFSRRAEWKKLFQGYGPANSGIALLKSLKAFPEKG